MKNKNTSTVRYFPIFQKEANHWLELFGLKGWEIIFDLVDDKENRASIGWKVVGRVACINLSSDWYDITSVTEAGVRKAAFHEVCELLLCRLSMMAEGKICNNKDCTIEEVHAIIRTLENVLFKKGEK